MRPTLLNRILQFLAVVLFGLAPVCLAQGAVPVSLPVINSISLTGTNLLLTASVPPGFDRVILEGRPAMDVPWEIMGSIDIEGQDTTMGISFGRPAADSYFFRLKARAKEGEPLLSSEMQYVAIPSLANNLRDGKAAFHFKGVVDGSDKIVITRDGALWHHVNWDWPAGPVDINGTQWNSREKNYLTTKGPLKFLPETFSLEDARLEVVAGRDVIALERAKDALVVYLDDTQSGAAEYEFTVLFSPALPKRSKPAARARLKIAGEIDGSDRLRITAREAVWEHKTYQYPSRISLNGIPWDVREAKVMKNEGESRFLPERTDFSKARVVARSGRDVATAWAENDSLWVQFADNPNGSDYYELEIALGE